MSDESPKANGVERILAKPFRAAGILFASVLAALFGFNSLESAFDAHIDSRAKVVVDSPERIARRSEMTEKHSEYEHAIGELSARTALLEHNGTEQTLTLAKISVTLEQVQKDVADIRAAQRAGDKRGN